MADIIVYTTPRCPNCRMVKKYLEQKKFNFIEKDVSVDRDSAREMIKKSGHLSVPQTEINGKIIIGFDINALEDELEDFKRKKNL